MTATDARYRQYRGSTPEFLLTHLRDREIGILADEGLAALNDAGNLVWFGPGKTEILNQASSPFQIGRDTSLLVMDGDVATGPVTVQLPDINAHLPNTLVIYFRNLGGFSALVADDTYGNGGINRQGSYNIAGDNAVVVVTKSPGGDGYSPTWILLSSSKLGGGASESTITSLAVSQEEFDTAIASSDPAYSPVSILTRTFGPLAPEGGAFILPAGSWDAGKFIRGKARGAMDTWADGLGASPFQFTVTTEAGSITTHGQAISTADLTTPPASGEFELEFTALMRDNGRLFVCQRLTMNGKSAQTHGEMDTGFFDPATDTSFDWVFTTPAGVGNENDINICEVLLETNIQGLGE